VLSEVCAQATPTPPTPDFLTHSQMWASGLLQHLLHLRGNGNSELSLRFGRELPCPTLASPTATAKNRPVSPILGFVTNGDFVVLAVLLKPESVRILRF
jgi:hypothetical protein